MQGYEYRHFMMDGKRVHRVRFVQPEGWPDSERFLASQWYSITPSLFTALRGAAAASVRLKHTERYSPVHSGFMVMKPESEKDVVILREKVNVGYIEGGYITAVPVKQADLDLGGKDL